MHAWSACERAGLDLWLGDEPLDRPRDRWLAERMIERRGLTRATGPQDLIVDLTLVMAGFDFETVWEERREFLIEALRSKLFGANGVYLSVGAATARPKGEMTVIDSVVLNVTERSCRAFQRLTGRTNVWLAVQLTNLSIIVYFVWAALWTSIVDVVLQVLTGLFCAALLYVLTQTVFKVSIEAYETAAYRRVADGLRNPRRLRDAPLRTSFLTLSVLLFGPVAFVYINLRIHLILLTYSLIVLTTVVLYLLACDPLPPCVGKVREWWRGLSPSRLAASETNPQ